jgi:trk system potassium uptake protein TrkH
MQYQVVLKIVGVLLIIFSTSLIPPILLSYLYDDGATGPFAIAFFVTLLTGAGLWLFNNHVSKDMRYRDGFMVVVLFWTVLALYGAIPLYLVHKPLLSFTDAVFESMSGLTTTGATVLEGIDHLPQSVRYYRQQLQWLGGMGIIVLAVAVMPMLGVGGMQLFRAETPGPMKDTKLTPRITETAKALWYIYLGLTVVCAVSYRLAGMTWFDAVGHSFSTVAIGGFSTHDASLGYFDSMAVDLVAIVFMLIAGVNFALHFLAWQSKSLVAYVQDNEVMVFLVGVLAAAVFVIGVLAGYQTFAEPGELIRQGLLQTVSIATTTGFTTGGYHWWPTFLPVFLVLLSFIGGCAGSTAGGIKVLRIVLLYRQWRREIVRLIHPNAMLPLKLGGKPVSDSVSNAVWGFFSLYMLSFAVLGVVMSATGEDWVTAFSAVAACLNNLGPGLGEVAQNYSSISMSGKWVLCFSMLLGRLELFTLLVLFSGAFWRS